MTTATSPRRLDVHRPSAPEFNAANYICLGVFDLHPEEGTRREHARAVSAQVAQGNTFANAPHPTGQCGHCGQLLRYAALMLHPATATLMHVGETCLDGRFTLDAAEFAGLRAAAAAKAAATREANRLNDTAAMVVDYLGDMDERLAELTYRGNGGTVDANEFLYDVARKLFAYGNLSVNQIAAVERAVTRDAERQGRFDARAQADAQRQATASPAPTGRVEVTGTVEHTWVREGDYGVQVKMRVRAQQGYVVISTVPAALLAEVGDAAELRGVAVAFTATLSVAEDPTAAFASRPSKARRA